MAFRTELSGYILASYYIFRGSKAWTERENKKQAKTAKTAITPSSP